MVCKHCGEDMIMIQYYGDGYEEPIEQIFKCDNCNKMYTWWQFNDIVEEIGGDTYV